MSGVGLAENVLTFLGGVAGAYFGMAVVQQGFRIGQPDTAVEETVAADDASEQPSLPPVETPVPAATQSAESEYKYDVFGVPTRAFNSTDDVYLPLNSFNESLRYTQEYDAMKQVVKSLDDMFYYESVMHGAKGSQFPQLIHFAEAARGAALRQLHEIVKFGDVVITSQTRKERLLEDIAQVSEESDRVLSSMQAIMASVSDVGQ
jgi:hypothetical protein